MFRNFLFSISIVFALGIGEGVAQPDSRYASLFAGAVVFKLKPAFRSLGLSGSIQEARVQALLRSFGLGEHERLFPLHRAPEPTLRVSGNGTPVDLSLLYSVKVADMSRAVELCNALVATKLFEYAELKYAYPLLYNPNDTLGDSVSGIQWHLHAVNAYEAWDIHRGDSSVFAAILDTGADLLHPDLKESLKYNTADTVDGIDNDGNGYIDDYLGWNLSEQSNQTGWNWTPHGVRVAGSAFATTDNITLFAGHAFRCKYMPVKVYGPFGGPFTGFEGIVYAADRGAKVINLSWGSEVVGFVQYEQDVIRYATEVKDAVVVAAAGNTAAELEFFPAAYEGVVSVGQTSIQDHLAAFATYSTTMDVSAPGIGLPILTTGGGYIIDQGSSFSAPQVAAAAVLLRSYRPHLSAQQTALQLRATADRIDTLAFNQPFAGKLGNGRLNMKRMLADTMLPGIELVSKVWLTTGGNTASFESGDTVRLRILWQNLLAPASGLTIRIGNSGPAGLQWLTDSVWVGVLATGATHTTEFVGVVQPGSQRNEKTDVQVVIQAAGGYRDFTWIRTFLRPDFLTLDAGRLAFTMTSRGKNGFNDFLNTQGRGVTFQGNNLMYESGLLIGKGPDTVSDVVRQDFFVRLADFTMVQSAKRSTIPGGMAGVARFTDTVSAQHPLGIEVTQRTLLWDTADQLVVVEYAIENLRSDTLRGLRLGQFNDWDIQGYLDNRVEWDSAHRLGFATHRTLSGIWAGVSVLGLGTTSFRGIDNFHLTPGGIDITDQFSKAEKFQSMQGIQGSGIGSASTTDISAVVGVELPAIAPGEKQVVALAYLADTTLSALQSAALQANVLYRILTTGPVPNISLVRVCPFDTVFTLQASNTQLLKVYGDSALTQLLFSGSSYTQPRSQAPSTYWVTNHDSLNESAAAKVEVILQPSVAGAFAPDSTILLFFDTTVTVTNTTPGAGQTLWITPTGGLFTGNTATIGQSQFTPFFPVPPLLGIYQRIVMFTTTAQGCRDTSSVVVLIQYLNALPKEAAASSGWKVYPNPASKYLQVESEQSYFIQSASLHSVDGKKWDVPLQQEDERRWYLSIPSGLVPGLYVLRLEGNENAYIGRISLH